MVVVIMTVCVAFDLSIIVSESKATIMCLPMTGRPDAATTFSVKGAGQVYQQMHDFV